MMRSLFSGVSGLRNHQTRMDVIGNNIANVNTAGFKASRTVFQDVYSQTSKYASGATQTSGGTNPIQIGLGVRLASIDVLHTPAATQRTDNPLDLAIEGDGFFAIRQGESTYYTRAGNLYVDNFGNLVTAAGDYILGIMGNWSAQQQPAAPVELSDTAKVTLPSVGSVTAQVFTDTVDGSKAYYYSGKFYKDVATTTTVTNPGLDGSGNPLTLTVSAGYEIGGSNPLVVTVFDAAGNPLAPFTVDAYDSSGIFIATITITTTETGPGEYTTTITGSPGVLDSPTVHNVGTTATTTTAMTALDPAPSTLVADKTTYDVYVDATGKRFLGFTDSATGTTTYYDTQGNALSPQPAAGVLEPAMEFMWDAPLNPEDTAGLMDPAALNPLNVAGFTGISIDEYGVIRGLTPSDEKVVIGYVAVATFLNNMGLEKVGNSLYAASANSGDAVFSLAQTNGAGKVNPGGLEMSNVDLSTEFTDMIITQRGFQANSRIITVSDSMLEELVNLKR